MNLNNHPSDEEIAAFLDGGLAAADRETVSRHLAECDECRALLQVTQEPARLRLTTRPWQGAGRFWSVIAGVAAVATLAIGVTSISRRGTRDVDQLRGDTGRTVEAPVVFGRSPADGARVLIDTLVLRWAPAGTGVTYDVSIVDDAGSEIWNERVLITDVSVPPEIRSRLHPGDTYYWRADAVLPDLRTASTGPQGFVPVAR